jgi:hypothetical protein
MGLFGGIKKLLTKAARTGLSVATGGLSDKVIGVVNTVKGAKRASRISTLADQAIAARYLPEAKTTESNTTAVLDRAWTNNNTYGGPETATKTPDGTMSTAAASRGRRRRPRRSRRGKKATSTT